MAPAVVGRAVGIAPEEASTSPLLSETLACAVVDVVYQAYAGAAPSLLFAELTVVELRLPMLTVLTRR